jgi:hypothetical protein
MVCMYLAFKKIGERNCFSPCLTIKARIFNGTIGTLRYHGNMPKERIFNEKLNVQIVENSTEI